MPGLLKLKKVSTAIEHVFLSQQEWEDLLFDLNN